MGYLPSQAEMATVERGTARLCSHCRGTQGLAGELGGPTFPCAPLPLISAPRNRLPSPHPSLPHLGAISPPFAAEGAALQRGNLAFESPKSPLSPQGSLESPKSP